jgi:hypothetical protein
MKTGYTRISKYCVNEINGKPCDRVGTYARKQGDMWIVLCDECQGGEVTLAASGMQRITDASDGKGKAHAA